MTTKVPDVHHSDGHITHVSSRSWPGRTDEHSERRREANSVKKIYVTKVEDLKLTGKCGKPTC
jgi:hypothetical protein